VVEEKFAYIREQEDKESNESDDFVDDASRLSPSGASPVEDTPEKKKPRNKYSPREIDTDNCSGKGFCGTTLRLLPNVRDSKVDLGEHSSWFKLFGMDKRLGTKLYMYLGPNIRLNRYLSYQYERMFKSIDGSIQRETHLNAETNITFIKKSVKWETQLKNVKGKSWRKKSNKF
jgi:hypothetical protein